MLHHQHGIAALLQGTQGAQQAFVVTRVQADGRLVQHIGHAHQTGAQLGGQTDALGLAAGKCGHGPAQGKIFQAHVAHEGQTVGQLLEQGLGHQGVAAVEVPSFQPLQGTFHGKGTELGDVQVVHAHGQGLGLETGTVAVRAVRGLAEAGQDLAPGLAVLHAFFQQRDDAGPALLADLHVGGASGKKFALVVARGIHGHVAAHPVAAQAAAVRGGAALFVLAVEQAGQGRVGKVLQRRGEREAVALAQGAQGGLVTLEVFALGPGQQGPGIEGKAPVGRDEAGLEIVHGAQAHAAGTGPLRAVEGKELRAGRGQGDMAVRTDRGGGMDDVPFPFGPVGQVDGQAAFAVAQGQLHGVGQAAADAVLVDPAVHHQVDAVLLVLVQGGHVVQGVEGAVHTHAGEAFGAQLFELVLMGAFLQFHQRRHDHELAALGQGHDVGDDLVGGAGLDGAAAGGTVHAAQTGEEDAQKVVDLRHRAHGGTGIARGALLFQRDGRGKALDLLHVRLVHLGQELPGIGRKGFHIAALALGIDDIEGQGGLAGTGGPADHHQLVAGDVQADVLEVVLPGFFDMDAGIVHGLLCKRGDAVWQEGFLISAGKNGPERWTKDGEGRIKFLTSRDSVAARGRYACFFLSADAHAAEPVRGPGAGERAHRPRGVRRPAHEHF